MHLHDLAFLGPGLLFLNQYFNSFIDEYLVLWIALVSVCTQEAFDGHHMLCDQNKDRKTILTFQEFNFRCFWSPKKKSAV